MGATSASRWAPGRRRRTPCRRCSPPPRPRPLPRRQAGMKGKACVCSDWVAEDERSTVEQVMTLRCCCALGAVQVQQLAQRPPLLAALPICNVLHSWPPSPVCPLLRAKQWWTRAIELRWSWPPDRLRAQRRCRQRCVPAGLWHASSACSPMCALLLPAWPAAPASAKPRAVRI